MKVKAPTNLVPHVTRIEILELHLLEEVKRGAVNIWGREVKLLNGFLKLYPEPDFWLNFHPGYQVHSLAFFKTDRGAEELRIAHNMYLFEQAQKKELDNRRKSSNMEVVESVGEDAAVPKKLGQLDWIDSL